MQFQPNKTVFDTESFSVERPLSPMGSYYSYSPEIHPGALHYHNFLEIGCCEQGSGIFNVNGQPVTFNGKCATIFYSGEPHIAQSLSKEDSKWYFLYIDLNCLFAKGDISRTFLKNLKAKDTSSYEIEHILAYEKYTDIYWICHKIIDLAAIGTQEAIESIRGLTYTLLKEHEKTFVKKQTSLKTQSSISLQIELEDTINYIAEHFADKITVDDLLPYARMSKSNLQRKMIAFTGKPPLQYVQYVRIVHASMMLLDKNKTIAEIANDIGYSVSCFNRQFLKEFKISPSEWRKQNC